MAFSEAFFFSVHTFATIGYGDVTPASWQADLVVTLESLVGLLSFGLAAGLMFACFARPNARIIFSRNAVIARYKGAAGFEFRIVNNRKHQIVELSARHPGPAHQGRRWAFLPRALPGAREGGHFPTRLDDRASHRRLQPARWPFLRGSSSMFNHDERAGLVGVDVARIHDVLPAPLGRNGDP